MLLVLDHFHCVGLDHVLLPCLVVKNINASLSLLFQPVSVMHGKIEIGVSPEVMGGGLSHDTTDKPDTVSRMGDFLVSPCFGSVHCPSRSGSGMAGVCGAISFRQRECAFGK
jgi:hypothetical protein